MKLHYDYNFKEKDINMRMRNNEKGITLITLVVTILIIIILSSVTITAVLGDDGFLGQASQIRNEAELEETSREEEMNSLLQYYANVMVEDSEISLPDEQNLEGSDDETSVTSILKEGDYVYYVDNIGETRTCVVLYDSSSEYGVQIITMETVEDFYIGDGGSSSQSSSDTYIQNAKEAYNNLVDNLNPRAKLYSNSSYSIGARSVGSLPNSSDDSAEMYTRSESWFNSYNGQFKEGDENYLIDLNKMEDLEIEVIDGGYWLASRNLVENSEDTSFGIRPMYEWIDGQSICTIGNGSQVSYRGVTAGIRPVFILKPEVKVTGGTGIETDPYTLGI